NPYMTVLTASAGLTYELTFHLSWLAECFAISNLRLTDIRFDLKLAQQTVNLNIKVKLTHTRNNRLPSFLIRLRTEGRIFLNQFRESDRHFVLVSFGFRLDRNVNNRVWERHRFQNNRMLFIA